jgi:hypothetical protein
VKAAPVKAAPVKAAPVKAAPEKIAPKKPAPAKPALAKASPAKPAPAKPAPPKPAPPKPAPAKPAPAKLLPMKAAPAKAPTASEAKKARLASRLAEDAASKIRREPRAYIEGNTTTDAFAEELGEDALRAITSGQDEEADIDLVSGNRGEGLHIVE